MKRLLFTACCLVISFILKGQEFVQRLNGFELGQFRDVVSRELGSPLKKEKYDDGFEYEIYLLRPDTSLYMIFEYSPIDLQVIWSIQLTGMNYKTDFKNMELGMSEISVIEQLGEPSRRKSAGEYGLKLEYGETNYSVEINTKNLLSSIKIIDESKTLFPKTDVGKIPNFKSVTETLKSNNNFRISEILSPGMELYYGNKIYFFEHSMTSEIPNDKSGMFAVIKELSKNLEKVNTADASEYEENFRLALGKEILHVIKIKKNQPINEIVFKYMFGKYLIWEIKASKK